MNKIINVKSISKISVLDLEIKKVVNDSPKKELKNNTIAFSRIFWNKILSKDFLEDFLLNTYMVSKKDVYTKEKYENDLLKIQFVLKNINLIKENVSFRSIDKIPNANDIFFSFNIFNTVLHYINDYFLECNLQIGLIDGVKFNRLIGKSTDLFNNVEFYKNSTFIESIIKPIVLDKISIEENVIYKFSIFWPNELTMVGILGDIIKKINPSAKIAVDLSSGNEQFDFTQWVSLIIDSKKDFFKNYDYFIIDRDFGNGMKSIQKYLNKEISKEKVKNIIFYDNGVVYNKIEKDDLTNDIFEDFIDSTFTGKNLGKIFRTNSCYSRFLPYKCYWSNCSFCAINSQNKFSYEAKYSYDYFIDKWIEYIKEFNITSLNFKDEALLPTVIIRFAKKIIENKLKINYQFRTRFELLYTYENCKILKASGCGFCGTGLESAVDAVNEGIGGKGNKGIKINDKLRIIHNFDKAGISFHNYSIMGFPGETDKQSAITYKFLKDNILNSNYYTCTPNIFCLMKGPKIFTEKESYGIEVNKEDLKNPFNLTFEFSCNGKKRNLNLLEKFAEDLHKSQLLPWVEDSTLQVGRDFWDYIDRSGIFYLLKRFYEKSPYYSFKNINNLIITKDFKTILKGYFNISNSIQTYKTNGENIYMYDWVGLKTIVINNQYRELVNNYDDSKTLLDNILINGIKIDKDLNKTIIYLIKNRIVMFKNL